MRPGQGRPLALDAPWTLALCAGVILQLSAPTLVPSAVAWALLAVGSAFVLAPALFGRPARPAVAVPVAGTLGFSADAASMRGIACFGALLVGASLCALHGHAALSTRLPAALDGTRVHVEVRVDGLPVALPRGARFHAEVLRVVEGPSVAAAALERRRLSLRWYGGGRGLRPGERWRLAVRLASLSSAMNPGDPDPSRRALVDGVIGAGAVEGSVRPIRLGASSGLHAVRDAVTTRIAQALGPEPGRFVAALAVGDTRGLSDADWERLRQFGLTHLIAISGFHVGLVAGLGVLLVRAAWWLWPPLAHRARRAPAAAVGALVVAALYAALAGLSLPTVRTVLMIAAVALVVTARSRSGAAQPLLLAVVAIVLTDPFALLTPGFWLSCGGVAWLLWCLPGASRAFDLGLFLKAQWVATLGLLPLAAAFFMAVPVAGPVANLVAIPWISLVVVPLSLLGTMLSPVSDLGAWAAWALAAGAMDALWSLLAAVPASVAATHALPEAPRWAIALALVGVAIALLPRGLPARHAGWLLVLPLLFPAVPVPVRGEFVLTAFALPRGDALLLRTATAIVLIDAGPAAVDLPRRLRAVGVDRVDLRIATRRSAGRAGGITGVDAAFPPREVWSAPGAHGAIVCEAGRTWRRDGVQIVAVSPLPGAGVDADQACVLRVSDAQGRVVWLSSDAGPWVARRVAATVPTTAGWVFGAPAALGDWHASLRAEGAVATRAPGPALARRWPEGPERVDRRGAVDWSSSRTEVRPTPRANGGRWWQKPAG